MISNKQFIVFESNLPNTGDLEYCTKHPSFLCSLVLCTYVFFFSFFFLMRAVRGKSKQNIYSLQVNCQEASFKISRDFQNLDFNKRKNSFQSMQKCVFWKKIMV